MRADGSENIEYGNKYDDAERFRNAYRSHFSDSFHKVFSEVKFSLIFYLILLFIQFMYFARKFHILDLDRYLKKQQLNSRQI